MAVSNVRAKDFIVFLFSLSEFFIYLKTSERVGSIDGLEELSSSSDDSESDISGEFSALRFLAV